jgi:putative oxidoreductase
MGTLLLIGRIAFGGFFIYSGVNHFIGFAMMTQYAKLKGVPFPALA